MIININMSRSISRNKETLGQVEWVTIKSNIKVFEFVTIRVDEVTYFLHFFTILHVAHQN